MWLSVWRKVQIVCIWSGWCHCIPQPYRLLPNLNPDWFYLSCTVVAWWRNSRESDLRSRARDFDSRPGRGCVTTLGKLFAPNCFDADSSLVYRVVKMGTFTFLLFWFRLTQAVLEKRPLNRCSTSSNSNTCLQFFDTVGCMAGRASGQLSARGKMQIVCIWSSWCHCIPKPHHLLSHINADWFYLSGSSLPRLSWKRGR